MKKYKTTQPESVLSSTKLEQPVLLKTELKGLLVKTGIKAGNPGGR
ncbi:hypothetical protein [Pseudoalteromonas rubra]|nr:hypothetical protein [Pseudoalteromonas rubra]